MNHPPPSLPLDPDAVRQTYVHALTRARNLQAHVERRGMASGGALSLDEHALRLVEVHLERAEARLAPRTELPGRMSRLWITRLGPVRRLLLKGHEYLFREQRMISQLLIASWRDFLVGYRERQQHVARQIGEYDRDRVATQLELQRQAESIRVELAGSRSELQAALDATRDDNKQLRQALEECRQVLGEQKQEFEVRLRALERSPASSAPPAVTAIVELTSRTTAMPCNGLDAYYLEFENQFRGSRADVRSTLERDYLPALQAAGLGQGARALDIGCGRGEWLRLLREWGLEARGVDLNPVMAEYCVQQGLQVEAGDGVAVLGAAAEASLDLVSAFHVIEHLPFTRLVQFFDQAYRALKPGGLLLVETPNPENLIVGSCSFWNDPTHKRPLPPEPTAFLLQSRGFKRVEILRLHPRGGVEAEARGVLRELMERLCMGQDYALMAQA